MQLSSSPQEIVSANKRRRSILPSIKEQEQRANIPIYVGRLSAYALAEEYDQQQLFDYFYKKYQVTLKKETLSFSLNGGTADVVFFSYGVVVFWGLNEPEEREILARTDVYRIAPLNMPESDNFEFTYSDKSAVQVDRIHMENRDHLLKVAVSHAIAQSTKLSSFESDVEGIVSKTKDLPQELATQGKVSLSRKQLSQRMGELFIQKNKVFLQSSILDKPDFLWEYQQYDDMYMLTSGYLDIKSRTKILNTKFSVVQEMFDMLRLESEARSSERQEWIVIILIFVELIFLVLETASSFLIAWYENK